MKHFRHICANGQIWDYLTPFDRSIQANEIPSKCPNKFDCGSGWESLDLSGYPNGSPFYFMKTKYLSEEKT